MASKDSHQFNEDSFMDKQSIESPRRQRSYKRWSDLENSKYGKFIQKEQKHFIDEVTRRKRKVFVRLSKLIKTKSIGQCKSHHQKMMKKCGSVTGIIEKYVLEKNLTQTSTQSDQKESELSICLNQGQTSKTIFYGQEKYQTFIFYEEESIFAVLDL